MGRGRFRGFSTDSHPMGAVHPLALQELHSRRIPTDGLHSNSWKESALPGTPEMDLVFPVCNQVAGEVCPVWSEQPTTAHWGMPDPAAVEGLNEAKARVFFDAAITMNRRLDLMLSPPMQSLDSMDLQKQVKGIGTR